MTNSFSFGSLADDVEVLASAGLFDERFYLEQNPDIAESGDDPLLHYVLYGAGEDRDPSPTFDARAYAEAHPEVREKRLNPLVHFIRTSGARPIPADAPIARDDVDVSAYARIAASGLFDRDWYVATYAGTIDPDVDPIDDYLTIGASAGRDPSPFFCTADYLAAHPEVANSDGNPLLHFLEGREAQNPSERGDGSVTSDGSTEAAYEREDYDLIAASGLFDAEWYLEHAPGAGESGLDPILHFLRFGAAQGFDPGPAFETRAYLEANPDIATSGFSPFVHYVFAGKSEGRSLRPSPETIDAATPSDYELVAGSEFFDATWYAMSYPDVALRYRDPVMHYVARGAFEGKDPGPTFSSSDYLAANPDVAEAKLNPLVHYLRSGRSENRPLNGVTGVLLDRDTAHVSDSPGHRLHGWRALAAHGSTAPVSTSSALHDGFDEIFYLATNADVAASGVDAFTHYDEVGRSEGRYPSRESLAIDAYKVEKSAFNEPVRRARFSRAAPVPGLSDAEAFLVLAADLPGIFEPVFYATTYPDALRSGLNPVIHFLERGKDEARVTTAAQLAIRSSTVRESLDVAFYSTQLASPATDDLARHYVLSGEAAALEPTPTFSPDYYVRRYADIARHGIAPFAHFLRDGAKEGRIGRPTFAPLIAGRRPFDPTLRTIAIASHEASRSGAPLVGLMLSRYLAERFNVITLLGKGGPVADSFAEYSCVVYVGKHDKLDAEYLLDELRESHALTAIVLNSVETGEYAEAALLAGLPSVGLLHEFSEYTLPSGRMSAAIACLDRAIVPARVVYESAQREVSEHMGSAANNIVIRHQGFLPELPPADGVDGDFSREQLEMLLRPKGTEKIVLGAGQVQIRKGIDLFVQAAAEVRRLYGDDFRFVWVGSGYFPKHDLQYSAWVASMVERLDLQQHVHFLDVQNSLETIFDIADIFFLSSRMDPFPNVALDAFRHAKKVVAFDRATGIVDYLGATSELGIAVPFCDTHEAARAIVDLFGSGTVPRSKRETPTAFSFRGYADFVAGQLDEAHRDRLNIERDASMMYGSPSFDSAFIAGPLGRGYAGARARVALLQAASGAKGLLQFNAAPGFNAGVARAEPANSIAGSATHVCIRLDDEPIRRAPELKAAAHVHLHYADLATEFLARFEATKTPLDLFLTTTTERRALEIRYAFRNYRQGSVEVLHVPNRGRDIAPLLVSLRDRWAEYEVVAHLHGKRSLAIGGESGDAWRRYLLDTLVGDTVDLHRILALFAQRPGLGIAFAEDRHAMGWAANEVEAQRLRQQLTPPPEVPRFPIFPLGTMFWFRPAALRPLFDRAFEMDDFPAEPLPYDGTMLHALERMMPSVSRSVGYDFVTLYKSGGFW